MSNQESESDYNEGENQEPEMSVKQLQHLQDALAKMKMGQLVNKVDYDIKTFKDGSDKVIINASGIKKLAFAFEISTEIIGPKDGTQIIVPPEYGLLPDETVGRFIFAWSYAVRASFLWPPRVGNLRWAENNGACSSNEDKTFGKGPKSPHGRPIHDVMAIALTRAIGRSVTSLLGGGLTSAELTMKELEAQNVAQPTNTLRTTPNSLPAPQTNLNPLPTRENIKQNNKLRTS